VQGALRRLRRQALVAGVACSVWLRIENAQGAPLGSWCVGLERLFGVSRVKNSYDREYAEPWVERQNSYSLLGWGGPHGGYSAPRVGVDYLTSFGLSAGAGLGIDALTRNSGAAGSADDPNAIAFVLAPRVGYFLVLSPPFGVWPRAGLTYLGRTRDDDQTAITLELPLTLLVAGERVALMLVPYLELGLEEGGGDALDENGALVSVGVFF
jgi:hypothetical protein